MVWFANCTAAVAAARAVEAAKAAAVYAEAVVAIQVHHLLMWYIC